MKEKVKASQATITNNLSATSINKLNEEIDFLGGITPQVKAVKASSTNDIFAKYRKK